MIAPGVILVSPPLMVDKRFQESVILICEHDPEGTWGICLNRPLDHTVRTLFSGVGLSVDLDLDIFWGGPVSPGVIWMMHDSSWSMTNTVAVTDEWSMTSHRQMFDQLILGNQPEWYRVFSGFSAWQPSQLAAEILGEAPWTDKSAWLYAASPGPDWAFSQEWCDLWQNSLLVISQQAIDHWLT
jgi:putative transcriptional regulator